MEQVPATDVNAMGTLLPRRKVRKGTHSCAECKRRKIRCIFDPSYAAVCIGCQRRGSTCIGQEFVDVPEQDHTLRERLKKVEQLLEKVTDKLFTQTLEGQTASSSAQSRAASQLLDSHSHSHTDRSVSVETHDRVPASEDSAYKTAAYNTAASGSHILETVLTSSTQYTLPQYAETCRILHAAFPSQDDTNTLFEAGRAAIFVQVLVVPYNKIFNKGDIQSAATFCIIPSATAHPVLLARKLLHHALCYQQLEPSFDLRTLQNSTEPRAAMHRYYELASSMVTCHDELLDSLEGLECLVYESTFLVNCGNLRRALVCLRRACTILQLMGLHRKGGSHKPVKQLDPATRVYTDFMWAHIAYLERYVSLHLGMPTCITNARFSTQDKLSDESETEWFEKIQIDIADDIISRNQRRNYDFAATLKIDGLLNKFASKMSTDWWNPMPFPPGSDLPAMMSRMISAQMQMLHYGLLTVLHLPFILRANVPEHRFDYSRETCLFASREILTRFITFRTILPVVYCCRPVDFCAFTACMTLMLAHLSRSGQITHEQRVTDRVLIEQTLEVLDKLIRLNGDELSRETARLTRTLFDLEAQIGNTDVKYLCLVADDHSTSTDNDSHQALCLDVPYFGSVKLSPFQRDQTPPSPSLTNQQRLPLYTFDAEAHKVNQQIPYQVSAWDGQHILPQSSTPVYHMAGFQDEYPLDLDFDIAMPDLLAGTEEWAFQGMDTAFFDSVMGGAAYNPLDVQTSWNGEWTTL